MKLSQFIARLQDFKIEHGDVEVFYADDSGYEYRKIHNHPTLMYVSHSEVNGCLAGSDPNESKNIPVVVVN